MASMSSPLKPHPQSIRDSATLGDYCGTSSIVRSERAKRAPCNLYAHVQTNKHTHTILILSDFDCGIIVHMVLEMHTV